jgi:hypothetical protein
MPSHDFNRPCFVDQTRRGALRRHRGRTVAAIGAYLIAYGVLAATLLPAWIVNLSAGGADANTLLNAVVGTRAVSLGVLIPQL